MNVLNTIQAFIINIVLIKSPFSAVETTFQGNKKLLHACICFGLYMPLSDIIDNYLFMFLIHSFDDYFKT